MIRFLQTPGPVKKYVLSGMLLVICAAMLVYLIPNSGGGSFLGGGPKAGVLATVMGEEVTTQEVQRSARSMIQQQFPRAGAQVSALMPYFAKQAAEQLISGKVILAEAERLGLRASDDDVRDELEHGVYANTFFPGGKFVGQDTYESMLQRADLTVPRFEQSVKEQIVFQKIRDLITGSATVTDAAVRQEFAQRNTKVKFEYAVLRKDDILKGLHPTDAELMAFYERVKASLANSIPEKRKIQFAVVDIQKISAQMQVTRVELESFYDQHRDEFRVPEQVNVRQILIKPPLGPDGKPDVKGVDEARKKADDVLKQLHSGAKFEDLAKKYSEDPSAKSGGSAGWIQHFPVPVVDKAAYSLAKGGTSGVIDAGYAFVILHIDDKQTARLKTLDEVKSQIEPILKQQDAAKSAQAQATALRSAARSSGLEKAAAAKGLQVVTTDFISHNDPLPGVGPAPQLMDAVFNTNEKPPQPDVASLPQGFAVFQLLEVKPPSTPTFSEIRSRLETEFNNNQASNLLTQKTQELSDRAKAGHDLAKAAKELGAAMKTSDFVLPDAQVPDIGSMSSPAAAVAFTLNPGGISGPIVNQNTGVVLMVTGKQEPSEQEFAAKKDETRDSLRQEKQKELFGVFVDNLRTQMEKSGKIQINQNELKALTKPRGGEEGE